MIESSISETVSESGKYGRPSVITEEEDTLLRGMYPEVRTRRGRLNLHYRHRAIYYLSQNSQFSWLCDAEKMENGELGAWQPIILTELGRIEDVEKMMIVALVICHIKPRAKDGAIIVKRVRLGVPLAEFEDRVAMAIARLEHNKGFV